MDNKTLGSYFYTGTFNGKKTDIVLCPGIEDNKMYFIDTNNIEFTQKPKKKVSFVKFWLRRIKAAWSVLRYGED